MDDNCGMEMSGMEMGGMMAWMLIWGLLGVALLVLAVVTTVWLAKRANSDRQAQPSSDSPEEILRRRYAAGEIDEEEYLSRRAGLQD